MSTNNPTQRENGLDPEGRYEVRKINDPTGKHDECAYFVLDPQHDPGARFALRVYTVWASRNGYEVLAEDLDRWLSEVDGLPGSAADTPTPERVTLTDGECCADYCVADVHNLRLDQARRLIEVLAAREQALREEVLSEVEAALKTQGYTRGMASCPQAPFRALDAVRGGAR